MLNVGKQIKEGRHVGLDFYDLLIEALIDRDRERKWRAEETERRTGRLLLADGSTIACDLYLPYELALSYSMRVSCNSGRP